MMKPSGTSKLRFEVLRFEVLEDRRLLSIGPFPTPLEPVEPLGSLIYEGSVVETIDLAVGQNATQTPSALEDAIGPFRSHVVEEYLLTASDIGPGDWFGYTTSISDNTAVVGARYDDEAATNGGAAYVFRFDGTRWVEEQKLIASDAASGDQFGHHVSVSGDTAIIGAWSHDAAGGDSGAAYVFRFDGNQWVEEQKLTPSDGAPGDWFGRAVAIDGNVAVIAAVRDNDDLGSVYVFRFDGTKWMQEKRLTPSIPMVGDVFFGGSVSVSHDTVIVGAYGHHSPGDSYGEPSGVAYVFRYTGGPQAWAMQQKLAASDGSAYDHFGYSVSIDADVAVVGAHRSDEHGSGSGSAYIFRFDGERWVEELKLTASDASYYDYFGRCVSISGHTAIIAAEQDDDRGSDSGSAYVFRWNGSEWVEQEKLTASDGNDGDHFGTWVSISGNVAIVGASDSDQHGSDSGAAYVYTWQPRVEGLKWDDLNGDGLRDDGEPGLAGVTIYLDLNRNGRFDSAEEPFTITQQDNPGTPDVDETGRYILGNLEPGSYVVAEVLDEGWQQTYPSPYGDAVGPFGGPGPLPYGRGSEQTSSEQTSSEQTSSEQTSSEQTSSEQTSSKQTDAAASKTYESGRLIGMDDFRADPRFAGLDGQGYAVAILDTGIDVDHPFFGPDADADGVADRIVYQYDFVDKDADASDGDGHGTNVASIVASQNATYTGMAPGVNIIALKVLDEEGNCDFSNVEDALRWVIRNATTYHIVSVNMSLSDRKNHATPQALYRIGDELAILAAMNVIVVAASGNDFHWFESSPGVGYPAADPNTIAVGAVYDSGYGGYQYTDPESEPGAEAYSSGADRIVPTSQRHALLTTVFAPGAPITGAGMDGV
ncbi:MAG: hypothetical protein A2V70_13935, partial [Planctomycetes bacterium RBG_13_63_9]